MALQYDGSPETTSETTDLLEFVYILKKHPTHPSSHTLTDARGEGSILTYLASRADHTGRSYKFISLTGLHVSVYKFHSRKSLPGIV